MDLIALLSSIAGSHDQSSFAGGLTYQDALVHFLDADIEKSRIDRPLSYSFHRWSCRARSDQNGLPSSRPIYDDLEGKSPHHTRLLLRSRVAKSVSCPTCSCGSRPVSAFTFWGKRDQLDRSPRKSQDVLSFNFYTKLACELFCSTGSVIL